MIKTLIITLFVLTTAAVAQAAIDGSCGSDNGSILASAPSANLCLAGTATPVSGNGPWNWSCTGSNGGATAACMAGASQTPYVSITATTGGNGTVTCPAQAVSGSSPSCTISPAPGYQLSALTDNGNVWTSFVSGGVYTIINITQAHSISVTFKLIPPTPVNGVCGANSGGPFTAAPTTGLCSTGNPSSVSGSGPWNWSCIGSNGGTNGLCTANPPAANGVCGASNGQALFSRPTSGLCAVGSPSNVSGTGPWNWICSGSYGGVFVFCAANLKPLRFTTNLDGTITDATTNLVWLQKADCTDAAGGIVPANGLLDWNSATTWSAALASGSCGLKDSSTAGQWRLPTISEWLGLLVTTGPTPSLPADFLSTGTRRPNYWSASRESGSTLYYVDFNSALSTGIIPSTAQSSVSYVWPVRNRQTGVTTYLVTFQGGANGTIKGTPGQTINSGGASTAVTAVPDSGYIFVNWSGTGGFVTTTNPLIVTNVTAAQTITATFAPGPDGACGSSNGGPFFAVAPADSLCGRGSASAVSGTVPGPWTWTCASTSGGTTASCATARDTTAPVLTLSTLADGSTTANSLLNVAGMVRDGESGLNTVTLNDKPLIITAGAFNTAIALNSGQNIITVKASDKAGNVTTQTRTITLDRTAPGLTITDPTPADNSVLSKPSADIYTAVSDPATAVTLKVNGDAVATATIYPAGSSATFKNTLNLLPGMNTIYVTATNGGKSNSLKRTIISDTSSPTLAISVPAQDTISKIDHLTVTGTVTDAVTSAIISMSVNGQPLTPAPVVNLDGSFSQNVSMPADNTTYAVTVMATDQGGNTATAQRSIIRSSTLTSAKVYLGSDDSFTVSNSGATLYGGGGNNLVTLDAGISFASLDQNIGRVSFSGNSADYAYKQTGNRINVYNNDLITLIASVPVQSSGTTLTFLDGSVSAKLSAGIMTLAGATVNSTAAAKIVMTPAAGTPVPVATTKASVYLGGDDIFTVSSSGTKLYGGAGNDTVTIPAGVTGVTLDQNVEKIHLTAPLASYRFKQTGNRINLYDVTGSTLIVSAPVQGGTVGTTLAFSDGFASALLTAGVMTVGGAPLSSVTPGMLSVVLK